MSYSYLISLMEISVDPDEMALMSHLIRIYTVS